MIIKTKILELAELLNREKKLSIEEISAELGWEKEKLELTAKIMEKTGLLNVIYPANVLSKPFIKIEKEIKLGPEIPVKAQKILLEYELTCSHT